MGAPGCDDAPLIQIVNTPATKPVTMIYPYYDNPNFLVKQLLVWGRWPASIRANVNLVMVDDCSPDTPAIRILQQWAHNEIPFPIRLFRVDREVRWNWLAARNIGAYYAQDGWFMLTDMDHVIGPASMTTLQCGQHNENTIYRFSRHERHQPIHPHSNSWFMTKEMYWRVGGYDERMSGYYGSDSYYRRRCAATAPIRIMSNVVLGRHEHDGDSSTIRYKRKQPEDAALRPLARSLKGPPRVLSFPYHEETVWAEAPSLKASDGS